MNDAEQLELHLKCDHILAATQLTKVCGSIWFAFVFRLEFQGIFGGVPPITFTTAFHFIEVHLLFLLSQWLRNFTVGWSFNSASVHVTQVGKTFLPVAFSGVFHLSSFCGMVG